MGRQRETTPDPTARGAVHLNSTVSASDAVMIRAAANEQGITVSEFVRRLVLPVAREHHREILARDATP